MIELVKELAGLARAALIGWPETVRLCLVLMVMAVAIGAVAQMLE